MANTYTAYCTTVVYFTKYNTSLQCIYMVLGTGSIVSQTPWWGQCCPKQLKYLLARCSLCLHANSLNKKRTYVKNIASQKYDQQVKQSRYMGNTWERGGLRHFCMRKTCSMSSTCKNFPSFFTICRKTTFAISLGCYQTLPCPMSHMPRNKKTDG